MHQVLPAGTDFAHSGFKPQKFPIGAQGAAAIYTGGGAFAALRRIAIRTYTWLNWLYPIPF